MAAIPGSVGLTGFIAPKDDGDIYAVHDEKWGRGGYRSVANSTERNAISTDRRVIGMLVYVVADDTTYRLGSDLTTWNVYSSGSGGQNVYNTSVTGYAGENLSAYRIVYFKSSDGKLYLSDSTDPLSHGETVGIVDDTGVSINEIATVYIDGIVTNTNWNFNLGPVYVGTDGVPTHTKPVSGYIMKIGQAITSNTILIDFSIDSGEGLDGGTF